MEHSRIEQGYHLTEGMRQGVGQRQCTEPELARLARITSCFPVAFEPVSVDSTHTNLQRWGKLKRSAVYLNGGILDNKPFSYTVEAIFRDMKASVETCASLPSAMTASPV
jgi:predicted acylesterase/phospholipase RssA